MHRQKGKVKRICAAILIRKPSRIKTGDHNKNRYVELDNKEKKDGYMRRRSIDELFFRSHTIAYLYQKDYSHSHSVN